MIPSSDPRAKTRYIRAVRRPSILALTVSLAAWGCTSDNTSDSASSATEAGTETGGEAGAWQVELEAGTDIGALMSVWGPSASEVYAVGGQPSPSVGTILRFDGEGWASEALPPDTAMLNWVYGVEGLVFTVGMDGTILTHELGTDGPWTPEPSGTDRVLWGVWGASLAELWAVGGDGFSDAPLLLRRDGATASWASVELPELGVEAKGLFKVWGTAADDVWIVGDIGATLHYDGSEWTAHPTAGNIDIISLWGSASEGIVAVGGRSSGRIARFDGASWAETVIDEPGLNGVWVDPAGPVTAVGVQGRILSIVPGTADYSLEPSPTTMVLHSVFGFEAGPRFAVGGSLLMAPPHVGIILRADE